MTIVELRVTNFRNLASITLLPNSSGLNIIYGQNGSGKTSLLEAIHYLGLGRSFRHTSTQSLIRYLSSQLSIFAHIKGNDGGTLPVGLERQLQGGMKIRLSENNLPNITQLAYLLPTLVLNSQSHQLLESGPAIRRKYLNWGLFYQSESFLFLWRQFERILKHRNAILRHRAAKQELNAWTEELIKYGLELDKLRKEYIQILTPILSSLTEELLMFSNVSIHYDSGWPNDLNYAEVLASRYEEEFRLGFTAYGPHRADLSLMINHLPVKHILSRGQQKLLICAMIIAQGVMLAKCMNKRLIYLIDDLPAELDKENRQKVISLLLRQQTQVFITAIEKDLISAEIKDHPFKVFHVEQGEIKEIDGVS